MNVSMEFGLNLLWAVVSLALLLGTRKTVHSRSERIVRAIATFSLVCVLFPIISITDDLNSAPAIVEARQSPEAGAQNQHSSGPAGALLALIPAHAFTPTQHQQEKVSTTVIAPLRDLFAFNQSRRPPPSFFV